jgi:hypothetical protein
MSITEAQARRALRHADIPWDAEVDDPREDAWVVHDHRGILGGLAAAFAVGRRNLRRAEDFFADLGVGARRALGLGGGSPCDTTLMRSSSPRSSITARQSKASPDARPAGQPFLHCAQTARMASRPLAAGRPAPRRAIPRAPTPAELIPSKRGSGLSEPGPHAGGGR